MSPPPSQRARPAHDLKIKGSRWYRTTHTHVQKRCCGASGLGRNENQRLLRPELGPAQGGQEERQGSAALTNPLLEARGRESRRRGQRRLASPASSWQWCWLANQWMEPRPRLEPSHCAPPASALPSTGRLLPWNTVAQSGGWRRGVSPGLAAFRLPVYPAHRARAFPTPPQTALWLKLTRPLPGDREQRGREELTFRHCTTPLASLIATACWTIRQPLSQGCHDSLSPCERLDVTKLFLFLEHFSETEVLEILPKTLAAPFKDCKGYWVLQVLTSGHGALTSRS